MIYAKRKKQNSFITFRPIVCNGQKSVRLACTQTDRNTNSLRPQLRRTKTVFETLSMHSVPNHYTNPTDTTQIPSLTALSCAVYDRLISTALTFQWEIECVSPSLSNHCILRCADDEPRICSPYGPSSFPDRIRGTTTVKDRNIFAVFLQTVKIKKEKIFSDSSLAR